MKKEKWLVALAAGAGAAGLAYVLWPKSKIPNSAIVQPFDKNKYLGLWREAARLPNRIEKNLQSAINITGADACTCLVVTAGPIVPSTTWVWYSFAWPSTKIAPMIRVTRYHRRSPNTSPRSAANTPS